MNASRAALVTGTVYAALFSAFGIQLMFWPLWLEDWGLTPGEVGFFTTLGFVARILGGFATPILADRLGARRAVLALLSAISGVTILAHGLVGEPALLLGLTFVTGLALGGLVPLGEAMGMSAAHQHGFGYARPRAVGSLAFLVTGLAAGWLLARTGADALLLWHGLALLVLAALALVHPGGGNAGEAAPGLSDIARLFRDPTFLLFVLAANLGQASHAVLYTYGSLHWRALGIDGASIGALWAWGVAVEVAMMLSVGGAMVARLGPVGAMQLAAVAGIVRWVAMAFDPMGPTLWTLQALHALSFGAGHLGAIAFLGLAVPDRLAAAAQGAYGGLVNGALVALGMLGASALYPTLGGAVYGLAALFSLASLVALTALRARWSGAALSV